MQQVPDECLFGLDVAIKKLRPYADFQLEGTTFTQWRDYTGSQPPTWDEVMAQFEEDLKRYEEWVKSHNVNLGVSDVRLL
jgi:hypothetical protein